MTSEAEQVSDLLDEFGMLSFQLGKLSSNMVDPYGDLAEQILTGEVMKGVDHVLALIEEAILSYSAQEPPDELELLEKLFSRPE